MELLIKILTLFFLVVRFFKLFKFRKKKAKVMKYRQNLKRSKSRKIFRKSASRTHRKNMSTRSMRGGNRL